MQLHNTHFYNYLNKSLYNHQYNYQYNYLCMFLCNKCGMYHSMRLHSLHYIPSVPLLLL